MVVGSTLPGVLGLVLRQGAAWATVGVLLGLAAGVGLSRFLEHLLFEVRPTDPELLAAVGVLRVGVALVACLAQARRAARVSPLEALRQE